MGGSNHQPASNHKRISLLELPLMPIRIRIRGRAGFIEFGDLVLGQSPADRAEVLAEVFFGSGAEDDRADGWAMS